MKRCSPATNAPWALWPLLLVTACGGSDGKTRTTDGSPAAVDQSASCGSMSCYVAAENTCDDYPAPTAAQCADGPAACANRSGVFAKPAACPTAGFKAKCTMPGPGSYVLRFYGARGDAADQSFCQTTAQGTWSTTF